MLYDLFYVIKVGKYISETTLHLKYGVSGGIRFISFPIPHSKDLNVGDEKCLKKRK